MALVIPEHLIANCRKTPALTDWLAGLPSTVASLLTEWSLTVDPPFLGEDVSCAWVAPATRADGSPAVLKLGMPHMEGEHEIEGLRFWNGDPLVRLLKADDDRNAMLLERCVPGTALRSLPEPEQDVVIAGLLRRLWRTPDEPHRFRPLAELTALWGREARTHPSPWPDPALVREGLRLFDELPRSAPGDVLLATDLHAGNVLRAEREPWLVIDPKPFVGDPAYDATQHLMNCERLNSDPIPTIHRFANLLELDPERVRLWMFARVATELDDDGGPDALALARALAP